MLQVRIKTWEQMLEEYGIYDFDGESIEVPGDSVFSPDMESLMPEDRVIDIEHSHCCYLMSINRSYQITDGMIAEWIKK